MRHFLLYTIILTTLFSCIPYKNLVMIYGSGAKFTSLSEAITNATEGDSIIVYPGKYVSSDQIRVDKDNLTIVGIGKPQILCDNMKENVFWVESNHVLIKGIRANHIKPDFWADCVGNVFALDIGHDIVIENCEINGCGRIGVYIFAADGIVLKNNWIHNNSVCAVQVNDVNLFAPTNEYKETVRFIGNKIGNNGSKKKEEF